MKIDQVSKLPFPPVWCLLFLGFAAIGACQEPAEGQANAREDSRAPGSAVVSIFTYDLRGNPGSHATGFFVSADGKLASTRHAIKNSSTAFVQLDDGRRCAVSGIIAEDPLRDLVLLQIKGTGFPFLKPGAFDQIRAEAPVTIVADPYAGTPATQVYSLPAPQRVGRTVLHGTVAEAENLAGDYKWFAIRTQVRGGESGCPVLNEKGEAIGMIRGGFAHSTKGLVVSADYIRQLLEATAGGSDPRPLSTLKQREYDEIFDDLDFKAALPAAQRGDNADAARLMKLATGHFPECGAFHVLLGSYYTKLSMWRDANAAFATATKLNPGNALAWASLGLTLSYQGKSGEAIDACNKAAELGTGEPDTWLNIGGVYVVLKHYDEARAAIRHLRDFNTREADDEAQKLTVILNVAQMPGH